MIVPFEFTLGFSVSRSAVSGIMMFGRAHSKAAQLLSGFSLIELTPYRVSTDTSLDVLASGFDTHGNLVVALANELSPNAPEVRLTVTGYAPLVERRVVTASVHGLGTLEPYTLEFDSMFSGSINQMRLSEESHLFAVKLEKCLLHDTSGVVNINVAAAADAAWHDLPVSTLELMDIATDADQQLVDAVAGAVITGDIAGVAWDEKALPAGVCDQVSETLILDLDSRGVTLMVLRDGVSQTVFAPFEETDGAVNDERAALNGLLANVWIRNAPQRITSDQLWGF